MKANGPTTIEFAPNPNLEDEYTHLLVLNGRLVGRDLARVKLAHHSELLLPENERLRIHGIICVDNPIDAWELAAISFAEAFAMETHLSLAVDRDHDSQVDRDIELRMYAMEDSGLSIEISYETNIEEWARPWSARAFAAVAESIKSKRTLPGQIDWRVDFAEDPDGRARDPGLMRVLLGGYLEDADLSLPVRVELEKWVPVLKQIRSEVEAILRERQQSQ